MCSANDSFWPSSSPTVERNLGGNYCFHFPIVQIFPCNFIFKENDWSNHPAGYHHISLLFRIRSTEAMHENSDGRRLQQHSAFPRQLLLLLFDHLFLLLFFLKMKMSRHIYYPAGILNLPFSFVFLGLACPV